MAHSVRLRVFALTLPVFFSLASMVPAHGADVPKSAIEGVRVESKSPSPLRLWYRQPANAWTEALPVGNGRLGAMVFGGLVEEKLQLNEDTLWTGRPHAYHHEGAVRYLPELRRLLAEGKQKEAHELASREFMSIPLGQEAYQPLGDALLRFPGAENASDYERELNLDSAVASVSYHLNGARIRRQTFSSHPDQVVVQEITADRPGRISFTLTLVSPHSAAEVIRVDERTLRLTGRVSNEGLRFAAQARVVVSGGKVTANERMITVENADSATVLLSAGTSFKNFRDISGDPETLAAQVSDTASSRSSGQLLQRHVDDYRALFRRMSIDLGTTPVAALPTDERLKRTDKSDDPQLAALYFQFGRYLLISSSRPGTQPANLQGIWNEDLNPAWGSKYTTNINVEMNYWPAEVANLSECAQPLFSMIDDLVVSGRETARAHYGAPGWVVHHNTDLWRGTAPINSSDHGIWVTGGAWLCRHLWEHYLFSGDRDFLARRAYPVMKQAAEFFTHYLVKDAKTGWLISGPSNSPEQGGLVMGPTMDHQIIRALLRTTAEAAAILETDSDFADKLRVMASQFAPNQVGRHGQLQEWLEDKDDPTNTHRHVSHLWALFPGDEIAPQTPDLFKAARQSLIYRGDDGTGWSLGWKVCFWARLLDGDHAWRMIMRQLSFVPSAEQGTKYDGGGGTYPNLFDAHPPFQIDGNFAATAGICEMLVQSQHMITPAGKGTAPRFEIVLLPALPSAWKTGKITGLRARGGFELDLSWHDGALTELVIRSHLGEPVKIRHGTHAVEVQPGTGEALHLDGKLALSK